MQKVAERGSFKIWMVDGSFIRGHVDEEFTNFGQHYRHLHIPLNELWIDQEAEPDERQFLIDPLLVEHRLMAKGMPYEKALVEADRAERKERRRAGDVRRLTQHGQNCLMDVKCTSECGRSLRTALRDGSSMGTLCIACLI